MPARASRREASVDGAVLLALAKDPAKYESLAKQLDERKIAAEEAEQSAQAAQATAQKALDNAFAAQAAYAEHVRSEDDRLATLDNTIAVRLVDVVEREKAAAEREIALAEERLMLDVRARELGESAAALTERAAINAENDAAVTAARRELAKREEAVAIREKRMDANIRAVLEGASAE